ncbi:hypothetical protein CYY_006464 [Polysphondylium violaceum]|uniref:N-acetyltransferase domain-containing protein n=1 Tax=Polysphondylium violaceum TaxID=133409 RepID=A0A8J4PRZ6_9MYCE|nr:hypothetical protein CYY_006464 [Polysphondylium violaceum]
MDTTQQPQSFDINQVEYKVNEPITEDQFKTLLNETTLGARRPLSNDKAVSAMLKHADILITAWVGTRLVGVARSLTDYEYCCYLSDLAVSIPKCGIGKELIKQTCKQLSPSCRVILLSAPQAVEYYPKVGFQQHNSCWTELAEKFL